MQVYFSGKRAYTQGIFDIHIDLGTEVYARTRSIKFNKKDKYKEII